MIERIAKILPFLACVLASLLCGCGGPMPNDAYGITVINPDPRIGTIFLTDPFGEREVAEVWSKSYFQPTSLSLRHAMVPGARAVFRGWTERYPGVGGYTASDRTYSDTVFSFEISDTCWMVSPRFEWTWNKWPLWLDDDLIVFESNRDSGESLWKKSPAGGAAERVSSPGLDGNGDIQNAHRLETLSVSYAWRGSPIVVIRIAEKDFPSWGRSEVWNATDSVRAVGLGGSAEWGNASEAFALLAPNGVFLWGLKRDVDASRENAVLIVRPDGGSQLAAAPDSEWASYAANGDIVFGLFMDGLRNGEDYLPIVGIRVIDAASGTMIAVPAFEDRALSSVPYQGSSVSNDGRSLLLAAECLDADGVPVGARLAIVSSDGSTRMLPASGDPLQIQAAGARCNSDGAEIIAQDMFGAWGRYRAADGGFIDSLPGVPSDAAPLIGPCWLNRDSAYRYHAKADATRPGGLDRVEERANGNNVDLMLIDAASAETWLTGPAAGELE